GVMLTSPVRLCRPCRLAGPAHAAATAGFSIQEEEIPRETDCLLEGTEFEPSVPLLRKPLLGVANRRRRHERRSHLQVPVRNGDACLEWLPIAFSFAEGPRVRIRLPPAASQERTSPSRSLAPSASIWQWPGPASSLATVAVLM